MTLLEGGTAENPCEVLAFEIDSNLGNDFCLHTLVYTSLRLQKEDAPKKARSPVAKSLIVR